MHTYGEGPVEATRELTSNLHEIRNRLYNLADTVKMQSVRLRRKNEQLIHTQGPETAKTLGGGSGLIAEKMPLISELNAALMQLEHEIEVLQANVSVTETI